MYFLVLDRMVLKKSKNETGKAEDENVKNLLKGIRIEMKIETAEICTFHAEKRKKGRIQRMILYLNYLTKGSDAYEELVRPITKASLRSNREE